MNLPKQNSALGLSLVASLTWTRDREAVKQRLSGPLYLLHTPRTSFVKARLIVCVCVCGSHAHLQNQGHVPLLSKMSADRIHPRSVLSSRTLCLCAFVWWVAAESCGVSARRVRGRRLAMKQTRKAGWQAWENLYRPHSETTNVIYAGLEMQGRRPSLHIIWSFICFIKTSAVLICLGRSVDV